MSEADWKREVSELGLHIGATLLRLTAAIALAFAAAVPPALFTGRRPAVSAAFGPLIEMLYAVPKISLFPLIVLMAGLNDRARIITVFLVVFFQVFISVRDAASLIPAEYVIAMDSLGAGRMHRIRFLYIPAVLPRLFTSLRIAVAAAFAVLFFTEASITSGFGLGRLVIERWSVLDYESMAIAVTVTAVTGFLLFVLIGLIEKRIVHKGGSIRKSSAPTS